MDIRPLSKHVGAEVSGVDTSKPLSDDVFRKIDDAYNHYSVLVFRDQKLTPEQQIEFSRRFGDLELSPRTQFALPWRKGSPVSSRDQPPQANRSMPLVANRAERSACSAVKKLTTTVTAVEIGGHELDWPATENANSGGSAETEMTEVAVKPISCSCSRKVTTVTPAGC